MPKFIEKTKNIKYLYTDCKRSKKIWTHFQKYYKNLTQKEHIPLQHILSISALSLPPKTKTLVLTLTTMITIINIKNELKNIIQIHYKQHAINNTLDKFKSNFCINSRLCTLSNNSLTLLL